MRQGVRRGILVSCASFLLFSVLWADDLLSPAVLHRQGYLRAEPVTRMWEEHRSGRRDWEYHLWDVLMFQSWLEAWDVA